MATPTAVAAAARPPPPCAATATAAEAAFLPHFPPVNASNCDLHCLFDFVADPCETTNLAAAQPVRLAAMLSRLAQLSAAPVPYDSCLPGCTAAMACETRKRYHSLFGPYYPPYTAAAATAAAGGADRF